MDAPITPPIDLPVPSVPSVPWFDGEHWHWAEYTNEGHILTCAANGQILFASPGVVMAGKKTPPN